MSELKAFTPTYVVYDANDPLGPLWALITLSPIFIVISYVTIIAFRRDLHSIFCFLGQLGNEGLNMLLKHIMDEERPETHALTTSGMPSAHAQFMMFFAVYTMLFVTKRAKIQRWHEKAFVGLFAHGLAMLVCYSRVHLQYHTISQVTVGSTVGILSGASWFILVNSYFGPRWFPYLESTWLAKFLLIRDTSHVPDIISIEYQIVSTLREAREEIAIAKARKSQ